jgi:hypothetical protein
MLSDEDIEEMVRDLVEEHLANDFRQAALDWLEMRAVTYQAVQELGLLEGGE